MSAPQTPRSRRRGDRVCRLLLAALVGVVPTLSGCRKTRATAPPVYLGKDTDPAKQVSDAYRADWDAMVKAREADPGGDAVRDAADRLLKANPPLSVRLAAMAAKAEHAYLGGDDASAVVITDEALGLVKYDHRRPADVIVELGVIRVRALTRAGDAERALLVLREPPLTARTSLDPVERAGLTAVALDRSSHFDEAVVAFAQWREALDPPQTPVLRAAAAYAETRVKGLVPNLDPAKLKTRVEALPPSSARACLQAHLGVAVPGGDAPTWVQRCNIGASRVGILLPRSGALSALADPQLAAASVAVRVLVAEGAAAQVLWRDSGSSPAKAVSGARALVADGAQVVVGPVGAGNIKAVVKAIGEQVDIVVPGETVGAARGVAPTLEARIGRLIELARKLGATRLAVAAPDNAYGRRAVKAIRAKGERSAGNSLIVHMYQPSTTSFAPVVAPLLPALTRGAALIIPDHLSRVELLVRQLARSGQKPSRDGSAGALILSTAEGATAAGLSAGRGILDGMWVAPAATRTAASRKFIDAYTEAQGEGPDDQALLVYFALRRALLGDAGGGGAAVAVRVEKGGLVPEAAR